MQGMNPAEFANISKCERDFWWYRGSRAILFTLLEPFLKGRALGRALEAGCGTGYFAQLLHTERGLRVTPMDLSPEGLRYARQMGVPDPVQGDTCSLPFASGAFDLVFSMDVMVHLEHGSEGLAVNEMARVLAPGGLVAIRAAALDILRSRHSEFVMERQRYTKRRLVELAQRAGLRVLRCTYTNSLLMPLALARFRIWEPLLRKPPHSGVEHMPVWMDRLFYGALALEAAWLRAGGGFPVGQSVVLIGEKPR
jgi:SAM-dependent methyltransferase